MSRDYMSDSNYYMYGDPQYFYNNPADPYQNNYAMQHQPGFRGQQYNLDWQGYPQQQFYTEYQPQEYQPYGYAGYGGYGQQGYEMLPGTSTQDPGQGVQGRQQSTRSKHSYSQNRNRNRQRPEQRMQVEVNVAGTDNVNINAEAEVNSFNVNNNSRSAGNEGNGSSLNELNKGGATATYDRIRNRGGRFHGQDTRSRPFDQSQQLNDRQRKYNKNVTPTSNSSSVPTSTEDGASGTDKVTSRENTGKDSSKLSGAKSKSYKDNRAGSGNIRNRNEKQDSSSRGYRSRNEYSRNDKPSQAAVNNEMEEVSGQVQRSERGGDEVKADNNDNPDSGDSGKDKFGGSRRKKKEIRVFSSSAHRDWQPKPQSLTQREANDRYNFRGQDYNKRHKEAMPSSGMDRGGDRTKLSSFQDTKAVADGAEKEDDEEDTRNVKEDAGVSRKKYGQNRGSRFKPKGKVDESQRGVLIEQLSRGTYECMVCCETVRTQHAVWSCLSCYHVYHLRCVKKWARSPTAVVSGSGTDKDGWRCPACQNLSFKFPNQYRCFCGKMRDPEVSRLETPHSCGDVCQKERGEGCKHPCNILCHPGPCPECNAIVTKSCDCGKTKQTVKCGQSSVIKCESTCGRQLNCGKHFCKAKCHAGSCEKCEEITVQGVVILSTCGHQLNSGQHFCKAKCHARSYEKCEEMTIQECLGKHETREVICGSEMSFQESYSCSTICSKLLDCGNHNCDKACHGDDCESCPRLPANVTHCPCGASRLVDLPAPPRTSCLDPVATCEGVCNKPMQCGPEKEKHRCERTCHEGPCGPCSGTTLLSCRCLFMDKEFSCSEISKFVDENGRFLCDRRCNRKKMCGRHKCGEKCCIKEEHPCDMQCGRKLSCGLHKCEEPCHRNNCPPCLMAGFDELTCYCGAEVMYPPIPCGTKPPECHRPCTRPHTCDHPVRHNCHSEESCPPCTELTQKMCMGNHVKRANIPCHLKDISCGMKCSRKLPCGEHSCIRICHKGECVEEETGCQQPCPRPRDTCEHPCGAPCHGEEPCPVTPCKAKVTVKCACGHREAEVMCSSGGLDSNEYQKITMQNLKESLQGIMGASSVTMDKFRQGQTKILECNKECALIERNRRVAEALDIQNPDLLPKFGSYNYTDFLKDFTKQNQHFVAGIEKDLSELVLTANKSKQPSRSHAFACMNSNYRRFIHELAESYGIETQSYDYEPKKNVVATAKKDKSWIPAVTLTAMVSRESHPRAPPPIPHLHKEDNLRQSNQAVKQSTTSLAGEGTLAGSGAPMAEGWQIIGKKTKKSSSGPGAKSAIATIDKFEGNLEDICSTGKIDYASLSMQSKEALKSEPVVDYFDFTVT